MKNPVCLIQLVSEQTMPNLLPILALRPAAVIHLTTDKTAPRSARIMEAAAQADISPSHDPVRLSHMPSIRETGRAVERAIRMARERGQSPVVNFTCGTKLMSIGAYEQAAMDKCPSFYVDTAERRFDDGGTAPGLADIFGDLLSFQDLTPALTLDAIVAANGHRSISAGRDWQRFRNVASHLYEHKEDEEALHHSLHGKNGLCPNGSEPRDAAQWLLLLDRPFFVPELLLTKLVETGLARSAGRDSALLPDHSREELSRLTNLTSKSGYFSAVEPLQQALAFMSGGWWEVIVAESMARTGRFRDIRWSAQITQQSGSRVEEDLVAIDGVEAVCISCKRASASKMRLLSHLEEFNSRARSIGGQFTRRWLAVLIPPTGANGEPVSKRAQELGIRLLSPLDLGAADPFV